MLARMHAQLVRVAAVRAVPLRLAATMTTPLDGLGPFKDEPTAADKQLQTRVDAAVKDLKAFGEAIVRLMPTKVPEAFVRNGELVLHANVANIKDVLTFLKTDASAKFDQLSDITAVDYPAREKRFEVVYNLLSVSHNARIRVKTFVDALTPVPSACDVFNSANWYERETYDMFGVTFSGHPDLRRLLTDYGYEGHPLRKDHPLSGYYEVRYDDELKQVVSEPLQLTQEFRAFDLASPWAQIPQPAGRK